MNGRQGKPRTRAAKKPVYLILLVVIIVFLFTLEYGIVWDGSRPIKVIVHPTSPREGDVVSILLKVRNTYSSQQLFSLAIHVNGRERVAGEAAISAQAADIYSFYTPSPAIGDSVKIQAVVSDLAHNKVFEERISVPPCPPELLSGFSSFSSFSSYFMSYITSMSYYVSFLLEPGIQGPLNAGIVMTITLLGLLVFMQLSDPDRIRGPRPVVDIRAYLSGMRNTGKGIQTRSAIIGFLKTRSPRSVSEISRVVQRCKSTVRRHLTRMEDRGIAVRVTGKKPFTWKLGKTGRGLETSLAIIRFLETTGSASVSQISRVLPRCKGTIRRHLSRMEDRGIALRVAGRNHLNWNISALGRQTLEKGRRLLALRSRYSWITIALLVIFLAMATTKIYLIVVGIV